MELRQYFSIVLKWLWLIVVGTVAVGGAAYAYSTRLTPIYESSATLLISLGGGIYGGSYTDIYASQNSAATYVEQIKSPVILGKVASELNVPFTPQELGGMMNVQQVRNTMLISIAVRDSIPARAQAIANQIAQDFIAWNNANQQVRFQAAQQDLDQQVLDIQKQIDDTQKALVPLGNPTDSTNATAPAFVRNEQTRLQMQLTTLESQYAVLLNSAQQFRLAASRSTDSITVSAPGELPQRPASPNKTTNTLLGAVIGFLLAVGIAFLIEYVDDTFKSSEDVTRALDLTTLGAIARLPGYKLPRNGLIVAESPRAPLAEAYRHLRTNLQFSLLQDSASTLVVSSAEPGEGKSTTAANLGAAWAQAGKSVILVDADLRRPMLHSMFGLPAEPGLTDLMLERIENVESTKARLQETGVPGMRVLVSGKLPPNPAELLASDRMQRLIEVLKQMADIVIFDSPPVLPVTDAVILASTTGNLLLVIQAGKTRANAVRKAKAALTQVDAKILGVVLNRVRQG